MLSLKQKMKIKLVYKGCMTHSGLGAIWEEDEMRGNVQVFVEGTLHIALFDTWTLGSLWKHFEVTVTGRKSEGKVREMSSNSQKKLTN